MFVQVCIATLNNKPPTTNHRYKIFVHFFPDTWKLVDKKY